MIGGFLFDLIISNTYVCGMSQILDFLRSTFRIPPTLPNGYPDMGGVMHQNGLDEVVRRINGGNRFMDGLIPIPPPIPMYSTPKEEPLPPMVSEIVNKIITNCN